MSAGVPPADDTAPMWAPRCECGHCDADHHPNPETGWGECERQGCGCAGFQQAADDVAGGVPVAGDLAEAERLMRLFAKHGTSPAAALMVEYDRRAQEIAALRGEKPYAAAVIDRVRAHAGEINQMRVSLDLAVAERDEARARIAAVRALHRPVDGLGYLGDGTYGAMSPVCSTCGKDDEYGVRWPCPTIAALDGQEAHHA